MIPLYQTRFFLYNRKGKHKFKKGSKSMREPICHKRNFHFTITCMALLLLLALVGCGNKNTQKDGSLQGNNTTQNQETQGEAGQDAQGTGNQDSQGGAGQDTQGTGNLDSQSTAGQDTQGPGNPGSQGTSSQDGQNTANQDGQNTANQGGQSGLANQPKIALEEAQEAALKHAGLPREEVTFIKGELDYEDGKAEYDIEFVTAATKYEYEISAEDGAVLSTSQEPVEQLSGNTQVQGAISAEEAKEAVLNHAGFTAEQVNFTKVELELDDGVAEYEIEFYADGKEYSSKVNASTGAILEYEID